MKALVPLIFFVLSGTCFSQESPVVSDTIRKDALNVYMDASSYFKKEITFINYVRDIRAADLYVISAWQPTGSGGGKETYFFIGRNRLDGMNDTITISHSPDETGEVSRIKTVKILKMALMRYVLKTPLNEFFDIRFTEQTKETVTTDRWNNWVFRTSISGYMNGEKSFKSTAMSGNFDANRTTEKNKIIIGYSYGWSDNRYTIGDLNVNSFTRSQYANLQYVRGINDHWSAGASTWVNSSIYSNSDFSLIFRPAIEYNIFPYAQSTRRQFKFQYGIGYEYYNYRDTTIYNKLTDNLGSQLLCVAYTVIEKWGTGNMSLAWKNYLHDWSKNHLSFIGRFDLRLAKGLSFNIGGGFSLVHDQFSLPKGGSTFEELLLRRKEIATQYTFNTSFGLTFTFGSIYNNAVNPRFGIDLY
ncbi:MAG: hypothetical protein WC699_09295 [Bacteroidales bacterium]|jgi:hypothetical protein